MYRGINTDKRDVFWDTVNNKIYFDIKAESIGAGKQMVITKNKAGKIEMKIERTGR